MKKYFLLLLVVLNFQFIYAQSGWFWQSPKYTSIILNDVYIIDQSNAVIVGDMGTLMKTSDSGESWSNSINKSGITGLTPERLYASCFININTGWVVGNNGVEPNLRIFKTTNSGSNWIRQGLEVNQYWLLLDVFFVNENTGWACGQSFIIRTTNGGINWIPYDIPNHVFNAIYFTNVNTGWAISGSDIYKTTDSGINWSINNSIPTFGFNSIYFLNDNTGFLAGGTYNTALILKTTNGGTSWNAKLYDYQVGLRSITFVNQNFGWAVGGGYSGQSNLIVRTTNGGESWLYSGNDSTEFLSSVGFFDQNNGITVGYWGKMVRTTNGGNNWYSQNNRLTNKNINQITQSNDNSLWLACNSGFIMNSTNFGISWNSVEKPSTEDLSLINFFDNNTGYVLNNYNIYKTTNAGQIWNNFTFNGRSLTAMDFFNESTGWVGAYRGINNIRYSTVLKTTTGGSNWDSVSLQPATSIDNIKFYDSQTGWLTGIYQSKSFISKTTDGGASWNLQYTSNNNKILKLIYILDENHLWIAADNENLLRTTNGGLNWQVLSFGYPNSRSVSSLHFIDLNIGWAIVNYPSAQIIKTSNGGNTWTSLFDDGIDHLSSLFFMNSMTGWATGSDGIIIKTTNGGEVFTEINSLSAEIANIYSLSQNYPNPFNPVTNIKFNIPIGNGRDRSVKLIIYDLLGKEIATLINQQMQSGSYSVDWDASNYPSGVYFYKLETENYTESKKMVLVK